MASDDLGFDKVEGEIKLIKDNGSSLIVKFGGAKPGGKGPKELAEYIAKQVMDQLPGPPAETVALRAQVEKLEAVVAERDAKIASLEHQSKRGK